MGMSEDKYTVSLEWDEETQEHLLPLSDELLEQVGWKEGDNLEWIDNKDGSFTLRKVENED